MLNYHVKSKLEQAVLNYIYPQNFQSPYSKEEICYPEFVNNFICIANVNAYNYQIDADTINKNYNRFINIEITKMVYLAFLRCSLIEERYTSAIYMISRLYPQLPPNKIEEKVREIQLADYLLVEQYIPNYISPKENIAIRCKQTIKKQFYNYDIDEIYAIVSDVQNTTNFILLMFPIPH